MFRRMYNTHTHTHTHTQQVATASLVRAVNDILDLTKIESGQMLQMHEDFDISKVGPDNKKRLPVCLDWWGTIRSNESLV